VRSALFNAYYWVLSIFYGLSAAFAALAPGRDAVTFTLRLYSRRMLWGLDVLAGVKVELKGGENRGMGWREERGRDAEGGGSVGLNLDRALRGDRHESPLGAAFGEVGLGAGRGAQQAGVRPV
jgi:hypothetical protein